MSLTAFNISAFGGLMRLWRDRTGLAMAESALLLPLILSLTFGIYDLGRAIVLNQKVVAAAQISADLITRERTLTISEIDQAVAAARLAVHPYDHSGLGVDVAGLRFDSDARPYECWRETFGPITSNTASIDDAEGLGLAGEGVIMVTTRYSYTPFFTGVFMGDFIFEEVAFFRGRKTPYLQLEGVTC